MCAIWQSSEHHLRFILSVPRDRQAKTLNPSKVPPTMQPSAFCWFCDPTSCLLLVSVRRVAPRFSIPPSNHEVMPGGSVNLTCVAVGAPMPYVKWMAGVEELTKEDEMPVGRNVLELNNIVQSANYTCVAISSLGMIEATAQITVKGKQLFLVVLLLEFQRCGPLAKCSWVQPTDCSLQ